MVVFLAKFAAKILHFTAVNYFIYFCLTYKLPDIIFTFHIYLFIFDISTLVCLYSGTDNTRRGHIIGAAQVRVPAPERQLTSVSTSVVRLLLHMSMYLGATESPQVCAGFDAVSCQTSIESTDNLILP